MDLCRSLIDWLKTFDVCPASASFGDLTDGVIISQVLHQICATSFSDAWLKKIKSNVSLEERVKISNMKKVVRAMIDYLNQVLKHDLSEDCIPDVAAIVECHDGIQMSLLLKLVLCCAVECDKRHEFISRITSLDESIQVIVMRSIQELWHTTSSAESPKVVLESSILTQKTQEEIQSLSKQVEVLTFSNEELEQQVNLLEEEKSRLMAEVGQLTQRLCQAENLDDISSSAGRRHQQALSQLEKFKEELFQMETSKHDVTTYCCQLQRELGELQLKNDQLCLENREISLLRDEVDLLRNVAEKLKRMETQVDFYKKKLDEFDDLKIQLKLSEESNSQLIVVQQQMEQEIKRLTASNCHLDEIRKQMQKMKEMNEDEHNRADKLEIENKRLQGKLATLQQEKQQLTEERNSLIDSQEELKIQRFSHTHPGIEDLRNFQPATPGVELMGIPSNVREKVFRLQQENKRLMMQLAAQESNFVPQSQLEDANSEKSEMEIKLRKLNYRILELEAESNCVGELQSKATAEEEANVILRRKLAEQVQRSRRLEEELQRTKEQASKLQIVKALTWKAEVSCDTSASDLKTLIQRQDKLSQDIMNIREEEKNRMEKEQKLIVTAWYNMGQRMQTKAALTRLSSSSPEKTFITKPANKLLESVKPASFSS